MQFIQELDKMDMIFFPVNISNAHWCLAVVYPKQLQIKWVSPQHNLLSDSLASALSCAPCASVASVLKSIPVATLLTHFHCAAPVCRYFDSLGGHNTQCLNLLKVLFCNDERSQGAEGLSAEARAQPSAGLCPYVRECNERRHALLTCCRR